ncbi:unknown [Prevotella sp. CAG:487]|nr:unknown [Prevotella sp. CAG:487]
MTVTMSNGVEETIMRQKSYVGGVFTCSGRISARTK